MRGLSLVAASGGHSSSRCAGLSLSRPLLFRSTGSRHAGSAVVAHGPSCSAACGTFPDQGSNPCLLHWQADSQSLRHQGSPWTSSFFRKKPDSFQWETVFVYFFKASYFYFFDFYFVFIFWLCCMAHGSLVPWSGIEPTSPAVEVWVLTTGPPGNSWEAVFREHNPGLRVLIAPDCQCFWAFLLD